MNEREVTERLHGLCLLADGMRAPGHRHTAEDYVAARDEIRDGLRRLYRDVTGAWPGHEAAGPERRPRPPVPSAVLRHRERQRQAARPA